MMKLASRRRKNEYDYRIRRVKQEVFLQNGCTSTILNCFIGKKSWLKGGKYRGQKLPNQGLKILEAVIRKLLREQVDVGKMQLGFISGRGTTNDILTLRELQEKYSGEIRIFALHLQFRRTFSIQRLRIVCSGLWGNQVQSGWLRFYS